MQRRGGQGGRLYLYFSAKHNCVFWDQPKVLQFQEGESTDKGIEGQDQNPSYSVS